MMEPPTHLHVIGHVFDAESGTAALLGGGGHQHPRGDGKVPVRLLQALLKRFVEWGGGGQGKKNMFTSQRPCLNFTLSLCHAVLAQKLPTAVACVIWRGVVWRTLAHKPENEQKIRATGYFVFRLVLYRI